MSGTRATTIWAEAARSVAEKFVTRDEGCTFVRVSDPDGPNDAFDVAVHGDVACRKATFADVMRVLQRVAADGMAAGSPKVTLEVMNAAIAPHMFHDEELLNNLVTLQASGHDVEAREVRKELLDRLNGIRSR